MKRRGLGRVHLRGRVYQIRYWYRGHEYRESSGSEDEAVAHKLLKRRLRETGRPRFIGPSEERLTFEELIGMLRTDYSINHRRSLRKINGSIAHLSGTFACVRAVDITTDLIKTYIASRQQAGAAPPMPPSIANSPP